MADPAFELRGVSAGYRSEDGSVTAVLRDVGFRVAEGELVILVGPSGSGKSTLIRLLNRFEDPIEGDVRFRGRPVVEHNPLELRRRVALVLQTPVMFEGNVRQNLETHPQTVAPPTDDELTSLLEEVGLSDELLEANAERLSVGERQRVAIARALLGRPDALLLDEPTSALDPKNTGLVAELLGRLQQGRGLTLVVVTHDRSFLDRLDGRRFLVCDGRVDADADADRIERFLSS